MLLTKKSPLCFSHEVIANLIEQLNIFGTSIDKFRRMLKLMVVEFVYGSPHLSIHWVLSERKCLDKLIYAKPDEVDVPKLYLDLSRRLKRQHEQREIMLRQGLRHYSAKEIDEEIIPEIQDYVYKKRQWFKAVEVLIEIVTRANEEDLQTTKERNTFRH